MDISNRKEIPMLQRKTCAVLVVILALLVGPGRAQQTQHDQHHPDAAAAPPAAMPGGSSMPGAGAGGMPVMDMMRMMMGQGGMPMMAAMAGHVEGRLAFLKTELKITDAQLPVWNAFAQAARENGKAMEDMMQGGGMMEMSQTGTLPDKLAAREKMLSARLDAVRKLKAAAEPLYAALSADQKKTADEIMVSPMGMMM
jgi:hypothetical protein